MSHYNESSAGNKYYFEVEWGTPKRIYLDKFFFGSNYAFELNGQRQFPENPVYIYPEDRNGMHANLGVIAVKEFYDTGSLFPKCSIGAEVSVGQQIKSITSYRFQNVKILELYGRNGDRYNWFYKFRFDKWL